MPNLALITGASSGIGLELAKLAASEGYSLVTASDTPLTDNSIAVQGEVQNLELDLSTFEAVDELLAAIGDRQVDVLCANAGHGLGRDFLGQDPTEWKHVIDTNITGTIYLIQKVAQKMVARGEGKILITGSIAGHIAGSFHAVYNGSKAFVDSFSDALGNELKDTGVTVTCLKPGATETEFFDRADMDDTKVGQSKKDDPADVAKTGWDAMKDGTRSIVYGTMNKLQVAAMKVAGGGVSAEAHRAQSEPGSGSN